MKVLLLKDIRRLGKAGEVKEVADGYARNYLIPRNLAVPATPGAIKRTEVQEAIEAQQEERVRTDATAFADRLAATALTFKVRASEDGRLYGSITSADIAEEIEKQLGRAVDKRKVDLESPLRKLGNYKVSVRLGAGVNAEVTVNVEALPESARAA